MPRMNRKAYNECFEGRSGVEEEINLDYLDYLGLLRIRIAVARAVEQRTREKYTAERDVVSGVLVMRGGRFAIENLSREQFVGSRPGFGRRG